jgi:penicillin amidase
LAAFLVLAPACEDPPTDVPPVDESPYVALEPERTIVASGLRGPVDVVRDEYGIPHIWATSSGDAAFANGYVMAGDRLQQMDLFRHFASGTVSELFGAVAPDQVDGDLRIRLHRMRPLAEEAFAQLSASTDPIDQDVVETLTRFADGVNQVVDELKSGERVLDGALAVFFNPDTVAPWTPVDTLAIGRLQTWALSYDDYELRLTEAMQKGRDLFPAMGRAGAELDLFPVRPMDTVATIEGFPNVAEDTGSRAKRTGPRRPRVPAPLLAKARRSLDVGNIAGLRHPGAGSNNWILGPSLTGGATLLANDPHLQLSNPPIWYFIHITVPGVLDFQGGSFAGIPGILLGHNEHIAWGGTVVNHDVTDFYLETIVPCSSGGGDCVLFDGGEVPIETRTETIAIGTLGIPMEERTVTYEVVPHHGPIIPEVQDGQIVPRTGNQAISVRYTGYEVTHEVRAFHQLSRAASVADAHQALRSIDHGAQNFVLVDDQGHFGWTAIAHVPWRSPGCFTYSATDPTGVAPFLVAPADGSCEWEGRMDGRYIPHAFDPPQGYLATANADPVGETFDGDALNGPAVDGRPLYLGTAYDVGFRVGRITRRLEELKASGVPATMEDMASIQADVHSNYGERLRPHIVAAGADLAEEIATPGSHPDLSAWVLGLPADRRAKVADAAARLQAWTLDTPAGVDEDATSQEIADSVATTLFVVFTVYFMEGAFQDELSVLDEEPDHQITTRTSLAVFERPGELRSGISPVTGQPVLCDDLDTASQVESCTLVVLAALDRAVSWAEAELGADPSGWRWGRRHTVTFEPLTPQSALSLPSDGGGYPRPGDNHVVDVGNPGVDDFDFTYGSGASMRHITLFSPGQPPRSRNALPGGQVFDPSSPHFSDLGETYWVENRYFDFPWSPEEIIERHEARWVLAPPSR